MVKSVNSGAAQDTRSAGQAAGLLAAMRIVLINTTHPGNIGAAARAMKVMGLRQLHLVTPKIYPHADATARASGADDLLQKAVVHADLESALQGCVMVLGTSARLRSLPMPQLDGMVTVISASSETSRVKTPTSTTVSVPDGVTSISTVASAQICRTALPKS